MKLCDIIGLEKSHYSQDEFVFEEFKKQLNRSKGGWDETGLIWRENNKPLGKKQMWEFGPTKKLA